MKKLGLIVRWVNPVLTECVQLLRDRQVEVTVIMPGQTGVRLSELPLGCDLYVLKSATVAGFSLAGMLHRAGARILNPYNVVAALRDKFVATAVLQRAGVRVPETIMAAGKDEVVALLADGPIVVKPHLGSRGKGVRIVRSAGDLEGIDFAPPILAQRFHPADGDGLDRKVFRIGKRLFGVRRRWPLRTYEDKVGTPFDVTGEMKEMALAVGETFGIDLYGMDFVVSGGLPYVVDVNKFGSYKGVPDGPRLLCDYLLEALG